MFEKIYKSDVIQMVNKVIWYLQSCEDEDFVEDCKGAILDLYEMDEE